LIFDIAIAMLLGWAVGYERYFNGRVSGAQVYCLVCMTACAVTAAAGGQPFWWPAEATSASPDPTRVVGSIIAGIGFLGAGILVHSGTSVRGLTTAASIWGCSVIGILVGMGDTIAAIALTLLFVACMAGLPSLERRLPARAVFAASVEYQKDHRPRAEEMLAFLRSRHLAISEDSIAVSYFDGSYKMEFLVTAHTDAGVSAMDFLAEKLPNLPYVHSFTLAHSSRG
jgi:putative Mg2+ transporter-C (MgtC) family protein